MALEGFKGILMDFKGFFRDHHEFERIVGFFLDFQGCILRNFKGLALLDFVKLC